MAHVQKAAAGFADQRERRDNRRLQRLLQLLFIGGFRRIGVLQLFLHLGAKLRKACSKGFVRERPYATIARTTYSATNTASCASFKCVDGRDDGHQFLDVAFVLGADKSGYDAVEYLCCFHLGCRRLLTVTRTTFARAAFLPQMQTIYCNCWDGEEPRNSREGSKTKSRAKRKSKSAP